MSKAMHKKTIHQSQTGQEIILLNLPPPPLAHGLSDLAPHTPSRDGPRHRAVAGGQIARLTIDGHARHQSLRV